MWEFLLWLSGSQTRLVPTRMWVQSLALLHGLRVRCCRELWCRFRHCSDPEWLWLWCRPAAAAPIQPLTWEPPGAAGAALKKKTRKTKKNKKRLNVI